MGGLSWVRIGVYALLILSVLGVVAKAYYSWKDHQQKIGWDNALAAVAAQNAVAKKAATDVRNKVDGCFNSGGSWNVSTGSCDR